jgi:hypothetical protein
MKSPKTRVEREDFELELAGIQSNLSKGTWKCNAEKRNRGRHFRGKKCHERSFICWKYEILIRWIIVEFQHARSLERMTAGVGIQLCMSTPTWQPRSPTSFRTSHSRSTTTQLHPDMDMGMDHPQTTTHQHHHKDKDKNFRVKNTTNSSRNQIICICYYLLHLLALTLLVVSPVDYIFTVWLII